MRQKFTWERVLWNGRNWLFADRRLWTPRLRDRTFYRGCERLGLAKDSECLNRSGLAFLRWASVRPMLRKLCQRSKSTRAL
jgi:hypothetical protein